MMMMMMHAWVNVSVIAACWQGKGWGGPVCKRFLRLDATLRRFVLVIIHASMGSMVGGCVHVPCTCVLNMMRGATACYGSTIALHAWYWNGSGETTFPASLKAESHKVPDAVLSIGFVFRHLSAPATPKLTLGTEQLARDESLTYGPNTGHVTPGRRTCVEHCWTKTHQIPQKKI